MEKRWLVPSVLGALGGSAVTGVLMLLVVGLQPPIAKAGTADLTPCPPMQAQQPSPDAIDAFDDPDNPGNDADLTGGAIPADSGTPPDTSSAPKPDAGEN